MNAFVTGGTGFVGSHLVAALRARGADVTCLVRSATKRPPLGWDGAVRTVAGDLDSPEALRAGCTGADVVFHVAGRISARNAAEFFAANRDGTARVAAAAAAAGARRLVYVSSLSAAGPTTRGAPIDESRTPAPVTDYGRSKLAGEAAVRESAVPWTIVRPPVVYGEGDRETLRLFRFARLGVAPVIGDGRQELSVVHAADLAAALVAAAGAPPARVYFATHPVPTTTRELVLAIGRAVGKIPRVIPLPGALARGALWVAGSLAAAARRATLLSADKAAEFLAPAWTCRPDALARDTGWRAAIGLEPGLARAAAWYRTEHWL